MLPLAAQPEVLHEERMGKKKKRGIFILRKEHTQQEKVADVHHRAIQEL